MRSRRVRLRTLIHGAAEHTVEFRPVLAKAHLAESADPVPEVSKANITVRDEAGEFEYGLGPVAVDTSQVVSARPVQSQQGVGAVALVLADGAAGIDSFNALASKCFEAEPECPALESAHGQVAVLVDGIVVSAPTIQTPSFEADQIEVSAGADKSRAEKLAAGLSGR